MKHTHLKKIAAWLLGAILTASVITNASGNESNIYVLLNAQEHWVLDANSDEKVDLSPSEEDDNHWAFECIGSANVFTIQDQKYSGYLRANLDGTVDYTLQEAGNEVYWELISLEGGSYLLRNVETGYYLSAEGKGHVVQDAIPQHDAEWILYFPNPNYNGTKKEVPGGGGIAPPPSCIDPCDCSCETPGTQPPAGSGEIEFEVEVENEGEDEAANGTGDDPQMDEGTNGTGGSADPQVYVLLNAEVHWILDANRDGKVDLSPSEEDDNHWAFTCVGSANIFTIQDQKYGGFLRANPDGSVDYALDGMGEDLQWELLPLDNGSYYLRNVATGKYLDANDTGYVDQDAHPERDDEWILYLPNPEYDGTKKKVRIGGGGIAPPPSCCDCDCPPPAGSVSGVVLDECDQGPLAGATVKLFDSAGDISEVVTGADGTFEFDGVPLGVFTLMEINPENYLSIADSQGENDDLIRGLLLDNGSESDGNEFVDQEACLSTNTEPQVYVLLNAEVHQILDANRDGKVDLSPSEEDDNHWAFTCVGINLFTIQDQKYNGFLRANSDGSVDYTLDGVGDEIVWELIPLLNGSYYLRSVATGNYLDANGIGHVDQDAHPELDDEWILYLPNPEYDGTKKKVRLGGGGLAPPPSCVEPCECGPQTELGPFTIVPPQGSSNVGPEVLWTTVVEDGTLGFNVYRLNIDGTRSLLNAEIVLAQGPSDYTITDPTIDSTGVAGYLLEEVSQDLETRLLGIAGFSQAAPPDQGNVQMIQAVGDRIELTVADGVDAIFAMGFSAQPLVFNVSVPNQIIRLEGEIVEGTSVYFSAPAGTSIVILTVGDLP